MNCVALSGGSAIVGRAEDQHAALLRQLADVFIERRELGRKTIDLGEIGDAGRQFLGGAEIGSVEHQQRRVVAGTGRAARGAAAPVDTAAVVVARPANAPRSLSVRGRTLILNPSGLMVSVSFSTIW